MAQRLKNTKASSPASQALDHAIDSAIAGNPAYPTGATFVDADDPALGKAIRRATDEGGPVVLVYADGSTRVLHPEVATT